MDWYRNLTAAPSPGVRGDQNETISSLGAGATQSLHYYATGTRAETWNMYAYADPTNLVLEGTNEGNNVLGPVQVVWMARQLYITGTFSYDDSILGPDLTIPCNLVVAYDTKDKCAGCDSSKLDSLAAGTITDNISKRFTIGPILNEDVNDDHGFLDIVVKVYDQSDEGCWNGSYPHNWFITMIDSTRQRWHYDSALYRDATADTLNVGPLKPTDYGNRAAIHVYKAIVDKGWSWARDHVAGSQPLGAVTVVWSPAFSTDRINGGTFYKPATAQLYLDGRQDTTQCFPDEWDDPVIVHEYAHHLANIGGFLATGAGGPHSPCGPAASDSLVWNEAWATYYACFNQAWRGLDPRYIDTGRDPSGASNQLTLDLENGCLVPACSAGCPNSAGPGNEAAVAGTLWDIYDAADDNPNGDAFGDSISDGPDQIWAALHAPGTSIRRIQDFEQLYVSTYAPLASDFRRHWLTRYVFFEHGIDSPSGVEGQPAAVPTVPTVYPSWPNPFNPATRIAFWIPSEIGNSRIRLRVYRSGRSARQNAG